MAFRFSKDQLAERDALAADLRKKAEALNIAIAAFNQAIEPVSLAVGAARTNCNPESNVDPQRRRRQANTR